MWFACRQPQDSGWLRTPLERTRSRLGFEDMGTGKGDKQKEEENIQTHANNTRWELSRGWVVSSLAARHRQAQSIRLCGARDAIAARIAEPRDSARFGKCDCPRGRGRECNLASMFQAFLRDARRAHWEQLFSKCCCMFERVGRKRGIGVHLGGASPTLGARVVQNFPPKRARKARVWTDIGAIGRLGALQIGFLAKPGAGGTTSPPSSESYNPPLAKPVEG